MITKIGIKAFRGLSDLQIPTTRVNILAGQNNSGKTSVLEALCLLFPGGSTLKDLPSLFRTLPSSANEIDINYWHWLFPEGDFKNSIHIGAVRNEIVHDLIIKRTQSGAADVHSVRRVSPIGTQASESVTAFPPTGQKSQGREAITISGLNAVSPEEEAELFNLATTIADGEESLYDFLKSIDPRLQKIRYQKIGSKPLVYSFVGISKGVPTSQMGQAYSRLLPLFCKLLNARGGIALIDEIENGINPELMPDIWRGLSQAARLLNIQIFATTHSRECIAAAREFGANGDTNDFTLHNFSISAGKVVIDSKQEL